MATKPTVTTRDMGNLSLQKPGSKSKKPAVADSWEDEYDSASEPEGESSATPKDIPASTSSGFQAPPPTPASPSYISGESSPWQSMAATAGGDPSYLNADAARRPEKTDAVARRMIASALGVKAPRRTEEERAYDRAVREKEKKRREDERAEERRREDEAEKAKAAIWND